MQGRRRVSAAAAAIAAPVLVATALGVTAAAPAAGQARATDFEWGHGAGQAVERLSLEDAVRRAVTFHETVLMARAEGARIQGMEREVRARSLPDLSLTMGYTRNIQQPVIFFDTPEGTQQITIAERHDLDFHLSLSQTLLDFSLGPARRAAGLSREATAAEVEAARTAAALEAKVAYLTVLLDQELVRVQEQALEQALQRLREVEVMLRAGTVSEFDLLTAQVEVGNLRPELIEARNRLALDRSRLNRVVQLPPDAEPVLTDSLRGPSGPEPEVQEERALARRPDVEAQRLTVELQTQGLAAERGGGLPSLDFVAGLTRRASSPDLFPREENFSQSATAGLSVSLPLFDGRARSGRVQQAEASVDRERYRMAQLRETVRLEVREARQEVQAARERIEASEGVVRQAERALEIAQTRFRTGLSTQLELNEAELAATRARTQFARALYAYHVGRARLDAALGER